MAKEEIEDNTTLTELGEAWDEHESAEEEVVAEEVAGEEVTEEPPEEPPEEAPEETPGIAAEAEEVPEAVAAEPVPTGLPPAAREAWKDTPKVMQDAIAKREADFSNGIKKYAESAKRADAMDRSLQPYQQYLATTGQPPAQAIGELLQTASMLQMGSPQQKAEATAQLIQRFGVDIQSLDGVLVGNAPAQMTQEQQRIQQLEQQQMQWQQQAEQQRQYQVQQEQQTIANEITAFASDPANEFYGDVRTEMANIIDVYHKQGQSVSLKDAYDRACMMNPDISGIISTRKSTQAAAERKPATASISGSPSGPGGSPQTSSRHDTIAAAWDGVGRA